MKRFHLHVSVKVLDQSVRFYSTLFAAPPAVRHADDAKWMIEDPRTGIAWETFHTIGSIPVYGEDTLVFNHGSSTVPTEPGEASEKSCQPPTPDSTDCCQPRVPGESCCAA